MDIEYFDRIWQTEEKYEQNKAEKKILWDSRAEEFNRHSTDERREKITGFLLVKRMLHKNSTVLDIGCGPGKFAAEFARRAKYVVGVDISPKMLQYASENAAALGLGNTEFREMDWGKADLAALNWKKKFSLVTGIMSPAFWDRKSLEKMVRGEQRVWPDLPFYRTPGFNRG
jgi:SAM-dependent methyltransferase